MARTRVFESNAARQQAYTARRRLVRVTLPAAAVETFERISEQIGCTRAELLSAMVSFAVSSDMSTVEFDSRFDARTVGRTSRVDVPMPEGVSLTPAQTVVALQFAVRNRQWARFGLKD